MAFFTFGEIFEGILDPNSFDFSYHEKWLDKRKSERRSIFNDAYLTCSIPYDKSYRPKDKHIQVLKMLSWLSIQIKEFNFLDKVKLCTTAEASYAALKIPMTGDFLRFEIWMDLAYAGIVGFSDNDFVMPGPGSAWGLMLLEGQEAKHRDSVKINTKAFSAAFLKIRDMQEEQWAMLLKRTGKNWYDVSFKEAYANVPLLSLSNIEGALCEWRKYKRLGDPSVKARRRLYYHE